MPSSFWYDASAPNQPRPTAAAEADAAFGEAVAADAWR